MAPRREQKAFQNWEMNCGPRSDTTSLGKPCMRNTWDSTASAVPLAEGNLGIGIKCTILENLSTTVKTVVLPSEDGNPVTKSKEMSDQGR